MSFAPPSPPPAAPSAASPAAPSAASPAAPSAASPAALKRKIAAILAADVAGYSRLVAVNEEDALRRLADYRQVFDMYVGQFGGRIFNTAGDSVMCEFPSAVEAVRCAVDIQEVLGTRNRDLPADSQMHFRIGLCIGDVVERGTDLLGDGVNIAARLQGLARPGGICISRNVHEAVVNKVSIGFRDLGPQEVKNLPQPVHAFLVDPAGQGTVAAEIDIDDTSQERAERRRRRDGARETDGAAVTPGRRLRRRVLLLIGLGAALYWGAIKPMLEDRDGRSAQRPGEIVATTPGTPAPQPPARVGTAPEAPPAEADAATLGARLDKVIAAMAPNVPRIRRESSVASYVKGASGKAFAVNIEAGQSWVVFDRANGAIAEEVALEKCQAAFGSPCVLAARDATTANVPSSGAWPARDMPRLSYSGPFDAGKIPFGVQNAQAVTGYGAATRPKALALHPRGIVFRAAGAANDHAAMERALAGCNAEAQRAANSGAGVCMLYAVNDEVIYPRRATLPLGAPPPAAVPAPAAPAAPLPGPRSQEAVTPTITAPPPTAPAAPVPPPVAVPPTPVPPAAEPPVAHASPPAEGPAEAPRIPPGTTPAFPDPPAAVPPAPIPEGADTPAPRVTQEAPRPENGLRLRPPAEIPGDAPPATNVPPASTGAPLDIRPPGQ